MLSRHFLTDMVFGIGDRIPMITALPIRAVWSLSIPVEDMTVLSVRANIHSHQVHARLVRNYFLRVRKRVTVGPSQQLHLIMMTMTCAIMCKYPMYVNEPRCFPCSLILIILIRMIYGARIRAALCLRERESDRDKRERETREMVFGTKAC